MLNEILFLSAVSINLLFIMLSLTFGRTGLVIAMGINMALVSTFAPKLFEVFGLVSNAGNIFYGSLFLAANILNELYTKEDVRAAVWLAFACNMIFITMGQFVLRFDGALGDAVVNEAVNVLFSQTGRVAIASIIAFLIVQHGNAWLYAALKARTGRHLWLRHGISVTLSQFFDSVIFFALAFYALVPGMFLFEAIVAGFILKALIGIAATPLLYAARGIRREERREVSYVSAN